MKNSQFIPLFAGIVFIAITLVEIERIHRKSYELGLIIKDGIDFAIVDTDTQPEEAEVNETKGD